MNSYESLAEEGEERREDPVKRLGRQGIGGLGQENGQGETVRSRLPRLRRGTLSTQRGSEDREEGEETLTKQP